MNNAEALKMRNITKENKELEKLLEEVNDDRVYGIKVNNVYLKGELFDETIEFLAYKISEVIEKIKQENMEKSKTDEKVNDFIIAYESLMSQALMLKKEELAEIIKKISCNSKFPLPSICMK